MSILVFVCTRRVESATGVARSLACIARQLTPDNITPIAPKVHQAGGTVIGVFNPHATVHLTDRGFCAGYLVDANGWDQPLSGRPDGAYAIVRSNDHQVEALSDCLASRSLWWFKNDDIFIASTSQRVVVAMMESFRLNTAVVPWILAGGMLGPDLAWDDRIQPLPGSTSLVLDRRSWRVSMSTDAVDFEPLEASDDEHSERITAIMRTAVSRAYFDPSKWAFPLSGGIDCRTILCLLDNKASLRTVTWGVRASLKQRHNDAQVAREVARHFGLQNVFYETDLSQEPISDLFDRFLHVGEGRIDHVSGYMDGFRIWKTLHEAGAHGIVRGDESFGRDGIAEGPAEARLFAMRHAAMPYWSDFAQLPPLKQFGLQEQRVPERLERRNEESLESWRDRLQHQLRFPAVLSALNDLKLPYVEVASPLLANSIVAATRRLPDHLRSNKKLLRMIAQRLGPPIPAARYPAIQSAGNIFHSPRVAAFLHDEMATARNGSSVPRELIDFVFSRMEPVKRPEVWRTRMDRLKRAMKAYLPDRRAATPRRLPNAPKVDFYALAFRITMISRMKGILSDDAAMLRRRA